MDQGDSHRDHRRGPEDGTRDTLKGRSFHERVRREFKDLKDTMLTDEQRARLQRHWAPVRWVIGGFWLLRRLLISLTTTRRILLLIGLVLVLARVSVQGDHVNTDGGVGPAGLILILFVLMLELKDKLLAKHELEDGHAVQRALMPERSPAAPGWRLWLFSRPANEVGGDLVDFVRLGQGKSALVIGDVAGKGLKAALLTAKLQAIIRAFIPESPSLVDLVSRVNTVFRRDALPQVFASLACASIEDGKGSAEIVNAGHPPPLVVRRDSVEQMAKGGPALGLIDSARFSQQVVDLAPGEIILIYSDGLIETRNAAGEFFGEERLRTMLVSERESAAGELGERLVKACDRFQGDAPAHDDLSMVILQRS